MAFQAILELLQLNERDRILELNCADGELAVQLAKFVPLGLVVGMDPGDEHIHNARVRARDLDNVMFLSGAAGEIPWKEDFFSKVISHGVPADLGDVLRVLAPDGMLCVMDAATKNVETCRQRLLNSGFVAAAAHERETSRFICAHKPS